MDSLQLSARQRKQLRHSGLLIERSSWLDRYREISEYLLPYSGRFFVTDRNMGNKTFNEIIDSQGTYALDTLSAGMMAGMTSPARPWFRLATSDRELMEFGPVKQWLNDLTELMQRIYAQSNTYRALHTGYEELGAFATMANIVESDFETVMHNTPMTAGEYCIAVDDRGRVNTLYREFQMTVANIVEKFVYNKQTGKLDWSVVSPTVKNLWDGHKHYDAWVTVLHSIEPRGMGEREYGNPSAKHMPYASCYMEVASDAGNKFLRESGYKDFPVIAARWATRGGDIYGHGPSFRALGHIKQLQQEQLRKAQGIDYMSLPPVNAPASMTDKPDGVLPGGVYFSDMTGQGGMKSVFDVRLDLSHLLVDIQDVRKSIDRSFYADLFLMLANDQRRQPVTAREIAERHEEKLLMLGPVLERLHDEMLNPMIDITFQKIMEAQIMPPPPPEMQGMDIKVEFVSTLAQAQRMVGLGSVDRLLATVLSVSAVKPDVLDKIDTDQLVDKYADMTGVDPSLIVTDENVAVVRAERQQAQAAMQRAATMEQMSGTAKNLAAADTSGQNALTDIMQGLQGYTTGAPA